MWVRGFAGRVFRERVSVIAQGELGHDVHTKEEGRDMRTHSLTGNYTPHKLDAYVRSASDVRMSLTRSTNSSAAQLCLLKRANRIWMAALRNRDAHNWKQQKKHGGGYSGKSNEG